MTEQQQDFEKAIARQKSYIGPAILVLFLYWLFFIPGLIANLLYLQDAKKTSKIAGEKPSGYGCLIALLIYSLLPFIGLILLILVFTGGSVTAPFIYTLF